MAQPSNYIRYIRYERPRLDFDPAVHDTDIRHMEKPFTMILNAHSVHGLNDNAHANEVLARRWDLYNSQLPRQDDHTEPKPGKYIRPANFNGRPQQDLVFKHVKKLRSEIKKHRRSPSPLNVAEPRDNEEEAENERRRDATRGRRRGRRLTQEQREYVEELLLSTRPLVERGLDHLAIREDHSAHMIEDLVPGLELPDTGDGPVFRLMPHQRDGIGRLEENFRRFKCAMLCDEMGLGKTPQVVGVIVRDWARRQARSGNVQYMVVVPVGLMAVWLSEFRRVQGLKVKDVRSPDVTRDELKGHDVLLVQYSAISTAYSKIQRCRRDFQAIQEGWDDEVMRLRKELAQIAKTKARSRNNAKPAPDIIRERPDVPILATRVRYLFIDEAQHIKNEESQLHKGMCLIPAEARCPISGTPIQNTLADLGALFHFMRYKPFDDRQLFMACFTTKASTTSRKKILTRRTRDQNNLNDAALGALRSNIAVRRVRRQKFDGEDIIDVPKWRSEEYDCELSSAAQDYQDRTRELWDKDHRRWLEQRRAAGEEVPKRVADETTLVDILKARLHVVHPELQNAKYSEFGSEDLRTMAVVAALGVSTEELGIRAAISAEQRDAAEQRHEAELDEQQRRKMAHRRKEFIKRIRDNPSAWRSDRLYAVAERIAQVLAARDAEANALPTPKRRKEYLSNHKILVFSEYVSAHDILEIGLQEEFNISVSRYDGFCTPDERDKVRNTFEEKVDGVPKDFNKDGVEPDPNRVMLITSRAGAEGVILVHASDVFILARSWNPNDEDQMIGRTVRKGQQGTVTVHRFFSERSIEERVGDRQETKRQQTFRIMNDDYLQRNEQRLRGMSDDYYLAMIGLKRVTNKAKSGKIRMPV